MSDNKAIKLPASLSDDVDLVKNPAEQTGQVSSKSSELVPELGEVWQRANGCLLVKVETGWCAFGLASDVQEGDMLNLDLPMRRLLLADGTLDPGYTSEGITKSQATGVLLSKTQSLPVYKGITQLRGTDMSFDTVRSKLAGLHFSKECLTSGEREILHLAELLMNLLDSEDPSGYRR